MSPLSVTFEGNTPSQKGRGKMTTWGGSPLPAGLGGLPFHTGVRKGMGEGHPCLQGLRGGQPPQTGPRSGIPAPMGDLGEGGASPSPPGLARPRRGAGGEAATLRGVGLPPTHRGPNPRRLPAAWG